MSIDIILAIIKDEKLNTVRYIRIDDYNQMLADNPPDKTAIADMIYHRFFGRYIKPFLFDDKQYEMFYQHGFAMMASSCLLIEALESFYQGLDRSPKGMNEGMFTSFFKREAAFKKFKGTAFYGCVRCGILHQGETTGGFTISKKGQLFEAASKNINACEFLSSLEKALRAYKNTLLKSNWDSEIWDNLRRKMRFIIKNCQAP